MDYQNIINKLINARDIASDEAGFLLNEIIKGRVTQSQTAAVLTALKMKGESEGEIEGFIKAMRANMVKITSIKSAIDLCGTGGDKSGTFNISTTTAFVTAGAGAVVAKHGNRSASSKCGSADVLEALGVHINISPEKAQDVLNKTGLVFLFAPLYHSALKNVIAVRKELGFPTIFNYLGPFSNPAGTKRQLVGVPDLKTAKKLAKASLKLEYERLIIVTSEDGLDEISTSSKTHVFDIEAKNVREYIFDPAEYGFRYADKKELMGGDAIVNAGITREVLNGKQGAMRNAVVLNSAFALLCSGIAKDIKHGINLATDSIDKGFAKKALENLIYETNN